MANFWGKKEKPHCKLAPNVGPGKVIVSLASSGSLNVAYCLSFVLEVLLKGWLYIFFLLVSK